MKFDFSAPRESRLYDVFRPLAKGFISLRYCVTSFGEENIPQKGAFILAANHISALDPVMIISRCPRTLHFMAKDELFKNPVFASFLKKMNVFPVKRQTSDKRALEFAKRIISSGWVLGIFPEGSRIKDASPKRAKNGVSYLAAKTKADVLPVSIYKAPGVIKLRPQITIRYGKLIKNSELGISEEKSQQKIRESSEKIMSAITALWALRHGEA
ncbi:MAG: 1-acyl-sn-glycerol-3-phosphate acyltransferase [Oscillospiraceae bacterium]|nr:1-acyl-sn-glycerol-3-phosphate acyltransferase [Oscillospiraceae bacterium]